MVELDNGAYEDTANFIFEQQKAINKSLDAEEIKNLNRNKLELYTDGTYDSLVKSDLVKRGQVNNLHKELNKDNLMRSDLEKNVIYRDYPKDLNNTPEDPQVIREKIYSPTIEYGAEAKALGIENGFVFKNKFVEELGSNFNLQDLQKQGFLLGDVVPVTEIPPSVFRIVKDRPSLNMLTGNQSGSVFTFYDTRLSKEEIASKLRQDKLGYLKGLGLRPGDFDGDLYLFEIKTKDAGINLYKPTNKDANFAQNNPYFRFNNSAEKFGRPVDLNTLNPGDSIREYVMKDIEFDIESLPTYIVKEKI